MWKTFNKIIKNVDNNSRRRYGEYKSMMTCGVTNINTLKECISNHGISITFVAEKSGILRKTLYNRMKTGDFKIS